MVQTQPVQIDVDMNYHDVLELLRPKMVVFESLEQANAAVQVREDAPSLGTTFANAHLRWRWSSSMPRDRRPLLQTTTGMYNRLS